MINNRALVVSCALVLIACGIFWVGQNKSTASTIIQQTSNADSSQKPAQIPDQVFYGEVFSLLVALDNTADYQKEAGLTDDQASMLAEIAKECQRDIAIQDKKAQAVILAFRQKLKEQDLEERDPKKMPSPPPELSKLQEGRDGIVLGCRDRLRQVLGADAFIRFGMASRRIVHVTLTHAR